jgi:hypothetical protein
VVPEFLQQLDFFKSFSDVQVVCPVMEKFETTYGGHQSYEECIETAYDNNLMILLEQLSIASQYSDMEDPYDRGFVNLLKIMVALYQGNPYTHDRIGWLMWAISRHIYARCYFPLTLDLHYDPRHWHRPGQAPKPPLPIPQSVASDGTNQVFGPEDDIWNSEFTDTG